VNRVTRESDSPYRLLRVTKARKEEHSASTNFGKNPAADYGEEKSQFRCMKEGKKEEETKDRKKKKDSRDGRRIA